MTSILLNNAFPRCAALIARCCFAALLFTQVLQSPAQDLPPLPEVGGEKPRDPTPEELAARARAHEAWLQQNLERFQPYLIKTLDQLAGVSPTEGKFLSLENVLRQRLNEGPTSEERWQAAEAQETKRQAEARALGLPQFIEGGDGGAMFNGLDESGRPIFLASAGLLSAFTIQTDKVWPGGALGLNLTGGGDAIAMWDLQRPYVSHPVFAGTSGSRVSIQDWYHSAPDLGTDHATRVAGILGGAQGSGVPGVGFKGMAFEASIHAYEPFGQIDELKIAYTNSGNIRVTSHPYGRLVGWWQLTVNNTLSWVWVGPTNVSQTEDAWFGRYDSLSSSNIDYVAFSQPYQLTVWAAGNEGITGRGQPPPVQPTNHYVWPSPYPSGNPQLVTNTSRPADGDEGGFDTLTPEATAKNSLVVGSVGTLPSGYQGTNSVVLSSFSSFGPSDAGLIKPDIVAAGEDVLGPVFPDTYATGSGTSFATPSVAGSVLLLRRHYLNTHPTKTNVLASTLKALVLHSADEVGTPGPDYKHGWGLMNTTRAAQIINSNVMAGQNIREFVLQSGSEIHWNVWVNSTNEPLKVTVVWTDPAGTPPPIPLTVDPTNSVLVNDLELRVIDPAGGVHLPWVLDPDLVGKSAAVRGAPAIRGGDHRNPVEQVLVWPAHTGAYEIRIGHVGTNLFGANLTPLGYQVVSVVATGQVAEPQVEPLQFIDAAPLPNNQFGLMFNSEPGVLYQLEYKTDLNGTTWAVDTTLSGSTGITAISRDMPGGINRFYRLVRLE